MRTLPIHQSLHRHNHVLGAERELVMTSALIAFLVGFGSSAFLRDYAVNAVRYVLSVAFKLFVMQLVLSVGVSFIESFNTATAELQDIFVVIGASIVLLALVKSLPHVVSGNIHGSHVNGESLLGAAAAVGGAAFRAGALAVASGQTAQNVRLHGRKRQGRHARMVRGQQSL